MTSPADSVKKRRDSNMELLRIVAMLLVCVVHANFRALPVPTYEEVYTNVSSYILRYFTESISIICVNLFVLLSGWYGLQLKLGRLKELILQVLFFSLLGAVIYYAMHPYEFSFKEAISNILLSGRWDYWFVKSYLGLYIFAPVLNAFVAYADKKQYQTVLIVFFMFQTIYAFIFWDGASYLQNGYSALSFMGLYLLARYVRLYPLRIWQLPRAYDLAIYVGISLFTTLAAFILQRYNLPTGNLYYYSSPLVIVSALHFMLFFTKIHFQSGVVNWIAGSTFAVYLLHSNPYLASKYYDDVIMCWYQELPLWPFLLHVISFILTVFIIAVLLDKAYAAFVRTLRGKLK